MNTKIIAMARQGDRDSAAELRDTVYGRLRSLAAGYMRRERRGHTLGATALVHEAYLDLVDQTSLDARDRTHFIAVAASAMRRVLVDHARKRDALKRGGERRRVPLRDTMALCGKPEVDLLSLDEALATLEELDARKVRVVELRFFGGMTHPEVATELGLSETTVRADWYAARAWLLRALTERGEGE